MRRIVTETKTKHLIQCDFCTKEASSKCGVCGKDFCDSHGDLLTYNCIPCNPFAFTKLPCICKEVCVDCIKEIEEKL